MGVAHLDPSFVKVTNTTVVLFLGKFWFVQSLFYIVVYFGWVRQYW